MAHDPAKVGDEVRLLTGILAKRNPESGIRERVNVPAMLDRPSAAPVKRTVWVRVPPLALHEVRSLRERVDSRSETIRLRCSSDGKSVTLKP